MKAVIIPDHLSGMNSSQQARYVACIQRGESQRLAEMLALQKAPQPVTDDTFFGGMTLEQQFKGDKAGLESVIRGAQKNGFTPNYNDRYEAGLCRPDVGIGDPEAFIPATGGRSYVKKLMEGRGQSCYGAVNVKHRQPERDPMEGVPLVVDETQQKLERSERHVADLKRNSRSAGRTRKRRSGK